MKRLSFLSEMYQKKMLVFIKCFSGIPGFFRAKMSQLPLENLPRTLMLVDLGHNFNNEIKIS